MNTIVESVGGIENLFKIWSTAPESGRLEFMRMLKYVDECSTNDGTYNQIFGEEAELTSDVENLIPESLRARHAQIVKADVIDVINHNIVFSDLKRRIDEFRGRCMTESVMQMIADSFADVMIDVEDHYKDRRLKFNYIYDDKTITVRIRCYNKCLNLYDIRTYSISFDGDGLSTNLTDVSLRKPSKLSGYYQKVVDRIMMHESSNEILKG